MESTLNKTLEYNTGMMYVGTVPVCSSGRGEMLMEKDDKRGTNVGDQNKHRHSWNRYRSSPPIIIIAMLPSAHTGKRFPTFRGRPLTASATLVVRGKTQRPVENSTADESDDELLLTTKTCTQLTTKTRTHHKHSVCALPQTRTPDSDDELDLLSPNKTHPSSRSAREMATMTLL